MTEEFQNNVRYHINRFIFDNGYAPTVSELSRMAGAGVDEVEQALKSLAEHHALVLHPNSSDIWVAHPFALFPTLFWVKANNKQWWGNCAWCSLGIASLTHTDTDIFTKLQGHVEPLTIHIRNNNVVEQEHIVHFPLPPNKAWDNVMYFCSNTLVFKAEADIDLWCKAHRVKKGEAVPLQQVWQLAQRWYGYYLDPQWKRKTPEFAEQIFADVGLTSDFWKMT